MHQRHLNCTCAISPTGTINPFLSQPLLPGVKSNHTGANLILRLYVIPICFANLLITGLFTRLAVLHLASLYLHYFRQMGNSSDGVQGDLDTQGAIMAQRRCIILAIVGSTPSSNSSMALIMESGFLSSVKLWLDDILSGVVGESPEAHVFASNVLFPTKCALFPVGGVDLLLHLLSNIVSLPVTKSNVKDSGMGKAIGSIEKHKMCVGTPNEASIKERVSLVKGAWQKSVKSLKEKNSVETSSELDSESMGSSSKREMDTSSKIDLAPAAKKARTDDRKKSSSLMSLLNKVKPDSDPSKKSMAESEANSSSDTKTKLTGGAHDGKSPLACITRTTEHIILTFHRVM